jgi:hypothetical protein
MNAPTEPRVDPLGIDDPDLGVVQDPLVLDGDLGAAADAFEKIVVPYRVRVSAPAVRFHGDAPDWHYAETLIGQLAKLAGDFGGVDVEAYDSGDESDPNARVFEFKSREDAEAFKAEAAKTRTEILPKVGRLVEVKK